MKFGEVAKVFPDKKENNARKKKTGKDTVSFEMEPEGFRAISRWLSEATPPETSDRSVASRRDASAQGIDWREGLRSLRDRNHFRILSGGNVALLLNHRLMD
jgi:hypothetical protein